MKKSNLTKLLILSLSALTCFAACKQPSSSSAPISPSTSETSEKEETKANWGTAEAPITVADAINNMKDWTGTEWSEVEGYLTGKIVSISKSSYGDYNAVLESTLTGNETFEIYGAYLQEGVNEPVAGSTVTVKGHFTKYIKPDNSVIKYEVAFSKPNSYRPYIVASDAVATKPETPETPSVPSVTIPENAHVVSKTAAANAAAKGWTNSALYSTFEISEVAKASVSVTTPSSYGQNSGKYYTKGTNWRIYQSETPTLKIELTEGNELVAVAISYVSENTGAITYDGKVVESGVLVAATGSSISFGVGNTGTATNGQARITEIKVAYLGQAPTEQEPVTPPSSETSQPSSSEKSEPSSSQSSSAEKLEPEFLEGATVYTFANYTAGTQYAANEEHVLDDKVTVHTTESHFTAELRIYSSDSHNGFAIFSSTKGFTGIGVNAGYSADSLNVYGSNDGTEYTLIGEITTAKEYNDYKLEFESASYSYIKLDGAGSKQIRLKSVSFTFAE